MMDAISFTCLSLALFVAYCFISKRTPRVRAYLISAPRGTPQLTAIQPPAEQYETSKMGPEAKIESLNSFNWESTPPRKFRPFKPIYHITMGKSPPALTKKDIPRGEHAS